MIRTLTQQPLLAVALWAAIYIADYALTLVGARRYRAVADYMSVEGSYELNPVFERDIDALRRLSPRFLVFLAATSALVWLAGRGQQIGLLLPEAFACFLGTLLLLEAPILLRHLRNLATFGALQRARDPRLQLRYTRAFALETSAADVGLFALLWLALSTVAEPWFFVGGALSCGMLALRHRRDAGRVRRAAAAAPQPAASITSQDMAE